MTIADGERTGETGDRKLEVAVFCGSLRRGSFNAAMARSLPELAPASMAFRFIEGIDDIPHYSADRQAAEIPRRVTGWAATIRAADAILFVTPEYNFSIPGSLKNALDWLSRLQPPVFAGKPTAIQTASTGMLGGARAQYHLRQVLLYLDAVVLNKPEIMVPNVAAKFSPEGRLADAATLQLIGAQLAAFEKLIGLHARL